MGETRAYSSGSSKNVVPISKRKPVAMSDVHSSLAMLLTARSEHAALNRFVCDTTQSVM